MNDEQERIPFDWDKYKSRNYEVVCRNGKKPILTELDTNNHGYQVIGRIGECHEEWTIDGKYQAWRESDYDLFLVPKQPEQPKPESDLIDFDLSLYESGQYELVAPYRDECGLKIINIDKERPLTMQAVLETASKNILVTQLNYLKLRKKKQKFQVWLNLYNDGVATVHTSKGFADSFILRTEKIEQRLIEWEA